MIVYVQVLAHYRAVERKRLVDLLNAAAYTPRLNIFQKLMSKLVAEVPSASNFTIHSKPEHWIN